MNVLTTVRRMRAAVRRARGSDKTIGLVPTMGALHEGHLSLIDAARSACRFVVVSLFVNPTQFGPNEDFPSYPRTPAADQAACRDRGADAVFMPSVQEMYGEGSPTEVRVRQLSETLCGAGRPGHFTGVCTVCAKLFHIVQPDKAFFGAKDFQQTAVLKRMVADLNFPLEIVVCPTVREADGLAMSSRNAYLSPAERSQAPALHAAIGLAKELILRDRPPAATVIEAMRARLAERAPDGRIEYIQIVDPERLRDVESTDGPVLVALAVRLGPARLIDNALVDAGSRGP